MSDLPRFLRVIREREAAEREKDAAPAQDKPQSPPWIIAITLATFFVAAFGAYFTYRYGELSEARAIQEQYSKFAEQSHESIKILRKAESMTTARLADIDTALAEEKLSDAVRACLDDLNTYAAAELGAIKKLSATIVLEDFFKMAGVPEGTTAAFWVERQRNQRHIVDVYDSYATEAYAKFNSERVRNCSNK